MYVYVQELVRGVRPPVDVCGPAEREALVPRWGKIARMPLREWVRHLSPCPPPAPGANRSLCIIAFPHESTIDTATPWSENLSHCDGQSSIL
jgi:hypothetical protein